ncbi:hypothetical protein [Cytophaga aurantiaca]|uniref:hypothetical protein n=1 Tax=Cytophaga aurantiaca TaxID=29530 RepID=UPI00037C15AF|nr:hypothetical protein [Cytophaga aurantiaca]
MINFLIRNKKSLGAMWAVTTIAFTAMFFIAIPFLNGPQPSGDEKLLLISITAIGLPLFFCLIMYIKSGIYNYKLNKNIRFEPYTEFFKRNGFVQTWIDTDSYSTIAEKAVVGKLLDKNIICRIDEKHMDRMDFVIYGLNSDKTKANRSYIRNVFDLQEPRFYEGIIYKSFNKTKILTAESISSELETLIKKYE